MSLSSAEPGGTSVAADVEGLEDYTEYHYRIRATNGFGTSYGPVQDFRTKPADVPTISNVVSEQVTAEGAHFSALVAPNWGETIYGFEYGETGAYGRQVLGDDVLEADGLGHSVSLDVNDLTAGASYHYRALAVNFGGVSYGPDQTFTTQDVPEMISQTATALGSMERKAERPCFPEPEPNDRSLRIWHFLCLWLGHAGYGNRLRSRSGRHQRRRRGSGSFDHLSLPSCGDEQRRDGRGTRSNVHDRSGGTRSHSASSTEMQARLRPTSRQVREAEAAKAS